MFAYNRPAFRFSLKRNGELSHMVFTTFTLFFLLMGLTVASVTAELHINWYFLFPLFMMGTLLMLTNNWLLVVLGYCLIMSHIGVIGGLFPLQVTENVIGEIMLFSMIACGFFGTIKPSRYLNGGGIAGVLYFLIVQIALGIRPDSVEFGLSLPVCLYLWYGLKKAQTVRHTFLNAAALPLWPQIYRFEKRKEIAQ